FVTNSTHPVDTDGHGTHLLTLLLGMECPADLYVARVTESSRSLKASVGHVANAIRTAAEEWDVDFICLSFGFPTHVQVIQDAISHAVYFKKKAITFFAAANNDGYNSGEMFPANLGEAVIPIRATTREGTFHPKYDPPPSYSSPEPLFGTLNYDVLSDWPGTDTVRSMSGCSVATSIAAAITTMLIQYASNEFSMEDLRLMRTRRGVFELFTGTGSLRILTRFG
ncbi:peptidase S8/S53 domain-containing protein, partial [Podospora australis]